MKMRSASLQLGLAFVGLVFAYVTWQRPAPSTKGEVTVWSLSKNSLEKVRFQDGAAWVELFREDGTFWLRQGKDESAVKPADAADAGTPPVVSEPPKPIRVLKAGERAEKLLQKFTPFLAPRGFGKLEAVKQKELGIDGATRTLEVFAEGTKRAFVIAPNNASPFARDEKTGDVYLFSSTLLNELSPTSQQLVDRRLHTFKATEFDAFTVQSGKATKAFVQTDAQLPQKTKVAAKETPDKPDEFAKNWHDRVWNKLLVGEVLGKGENPAQGAPTVELRIEYFYRGKSVGFLELAPMDGKQVWAKTEHTASWVVVPQMGTEVLAEALRVATGS